jgi:hypothetical protein
MTVEELLSLQVGQRVWWEILDLSGEVVGRHGYDLEILWSNGQTNIISPADGDDDIDEFTVHDLLALRTAAEVAATVVQRVEVDMVHFPAARQVQAHVSGNNLMGKDGPHLAVNPAANDGVAVDIQPPRPFRQQVREVFVIAQAELAGRFVMLTAARTDLPHKFNMVHSRSLLI